MNSIKTERELVLQMRISTKRGKDVELSGEGERSRERERLRIMVRNDILYYMKRIYNNS